MNKKIDVLVVGAGLSGIGAGYHLQKKCPETSFLILEGRENIGGTWDLFKYPGIRSDSDMYTLGYNFKPWKEQKAIADAPSILKYLNETVEEFNLKSKIRFGKYVKKADELQEKKKDTPDQVKAVIAYDKARKATDDATYDSIHGDKKQAKKERDYAKWQRDTGARDAQKSGHPWEHAKGSTREKEGKKSEKHAHIKDSYEVLPVKSIEDMTKIYFEGVLKKEVKALKKGADTLKQKDIDKADAIADEYVPSETVKKLVESGKFTKEEILKIVEVESLGK